MRILIANVQSHIEVIRMAVLKTLEYLLDALNCSLENQIVDDNESQQDIALGGSNYDEEEQAGTRMELEKILNVEMLSQPPYSLVNLTENLLPLNINSTVDNLLGLIEQYRQSPEGLEILELTLKNLQGDPGSA